MYLKALEAEEEGDVAKAFSLFLQGALLGDDGAQNAVGLAYDSGSGVEKDKKKAISWFKKAWRTGRQSYLCGNIALTYAELGNQRQAVYWWRKAVAQDDGDAALALAKFYMKSKPQKATDKVLSLLRMAVDCEESLEISPAAKEEAQESLDELTSQGR